MNRARALARPSKGGRSTARAVVLLCLAAALSPLWLGPLLTPLRIAVAGMHHACACGMAPGRCGCPECEKQDARRLSSEAEEDRPVLKGECQKGDAVLGDTQVPPPLVPVVPALVTVLPEGALPALAYASPRSIAEGPPPTPPPEGSAG